MPRGACGDISPAPGPLPTLDGGADPRYVGRVTAPRSPRGRASSGDGWTRAERAALARLSSPERVQRWLDGVPYRAEESTACPRTVLRERLANCWDGALFAAAALRELGHPPLLLDLHAVRDDDHVLALFRARRRWGAVGKSNFVGLRFREPVYRDVRELVMSYFELYFNTAGEKTLRAFLGPYDLRRWDRLRWTFEDAAIPRISREIDARRHAPLLTPAMVRGLGKVDPRSLEAGMVGTDPAGVYALGAATASRR
jgi:hypothetical protein